MSIPTTKNSFVILTAARNEARHIARTIETVLSQSCRPKRWIIVSDRSTDDTDRIVRSYQESNDFLMLIHKGDDGSCGFASKVAAIDLAYHHLENEQYEFIGNLDADVSFAPNYYEDVIRRFNVNLKLGIGGGLVFEVTGLRSTPQRTSRNSVAGAVQLFRRECFEAIGGYYPFELGGEDAAAEIMARMHGWQVQTFWDLHVMHHGYDKNTRIGMLRKRWKWGSMFYNLGYHPIFQIARSFMRIVQSPVVLGSILELGGYIWAYVKGAKRAMPKEVVNYLRCEQVRRLCNQLRKVV
jgi:biofilm PGA synthesis N-glycosyltransferase PgaC